MHEHQPLGYARPATKRSRRPLFVVPPKISRPAGWLSLLLLVPAFLYYHDHKFVRDYNPLWWQQVTPLATAGALLLAGIGCLRDRDRRRRGLPAAALGLLLAGAIFLAIVLLPGATVDGESGDRIKCASNLRQIGQALTLYATAHGGALPPDFGALYLDQELVSENFVCPLGSDTPARAKTRAAEAAMMANHLHCSYTYLGAGHRDDLPATAVLAYEPLADHSKDGSNVLFGDGHVEFLPPAQLSAALAASPPPPPSATTSPATLPTTQPKAGG